MNSKQQSCAVRNNNTNTQEENTMKMKSTTATKTFSAMMAIALAWMAALVLPASVLGATVTMTANDLSTPISFNSAGKWSDAAAPSTGNDYYTAGYLMRSFATATTATFQGDSLTIGGAPGSPLAGRFLYKSACDLTVSNLKLNGGLLDIAGTGPITGTLRGGLTVLSASYIVSYGSVLYSAHTLDIRSTITGSANLQVGLAANTTFAGTPYTATDGYGIVRFSGANPDYSGIITVNGSGSASGVSTTHGAFSLNNLNAVQKATVKFNYANSTVAPAMSFLAGSNTGTYNIGALETTVSSRLKLEDTAGNAVAINVGGNNASTSFNGVLTGSGSLTKSGIGTLTLSGANNYTGNTTVTGGTVVWNNACLSASADLICVNAPTIQLDYVGNNTIRRLYVNGQSRPLGVYNAANAPAGMTITGTGALVVTDTEPPQGTVISIR